MQITLTQKSSRLWVMHLIGKLDGSNYRRLLAESELLYENGCRDVILDLSQLVFISSTGIAALHRVALIFRGQKLSSGDDEIQLTPQGIVKELKSNRQKHVKFFSSTENVRHTLEIVGFDTLFETFTDMDQAIASFR